ncbi:MAG: hypothetical protein MMC33_009921 [Icmadophila ericetorum]|nr:hypothetical protein [Icmadophila ericetorum]
MATNPKKSERLSLATHAQIEPPTAPETTPPSQNPTKPASSFPSPTALNSFIVSQQSGRQIPPRNKQGVSSGQIPEKYKPAARKITATMVALPIAFVTSWILYDRLVLGNEKKRLVKLGEDEGG